MGRTSSTTHRWHFCRALYLQPSTQKLGWRGFGEDREFSEFGDYGDYGDYGDHYP